jgi:hypothetical protein
VTHDGTVFIWFVNHSDTSWFRAALKAIRTATGTWTRVIARKAANTYDLYKPEGDIPEPDWSGRPDFAAMMENAFEDRLITTTDHPMPRRLRGYDADTMRRSDSISMFNSVWVVDTEFWSSDDEPNRPVALCARELWTGRRLELFFDQEQSNPFDYSVPYSSPTTQRRNGRLSSPWAGTCPTTSSNRTSST